MREEEMLFVSHHGGFGGAVNLNQAFSNYSARYKTHLITAIPSPYQFGDGLMVGKDFAAVDRLMSRVKKLFICDYHGLITVAAYLSKKTGMRLSHAPDAGNSVVAKWLAGKSLIFFWSGTRYRAGHDKINSYVGGLPCLRRFAMCDLLWCDPDAVPLMQPFELVNTSTPFRKFTVCHTPGAKYHVVGQDKGTDLIESVCKQLHTPIEILRGVPYVQAIETKSRCHVFVDQIMPLGGVGKSGLEAMRLGLPTVYGGGKCQFVGYYGGCPVVKACTEQELYVALQRLRDDPAYYRDVADASHLWGQRLGYKQTVDYIESNMVWA